MKKLIFCASLVCLGMTTSCQKDELVPANEKPEWLGSSIYEELQNPKHLSGTFNTYLRLVDDLGYGEVLSKTGSKTIFPANDEAFNRFFTSKNVYGVSSYEQLTPGMKKQLLYTSMLDNAMLAGMLSNVKADDNNVTRGTALKHETNVSVIDSVSAIYLGAQMPQNNTYWDNYRSKGIHVVYDATKPMLVHFTREQMLNNNITTSGTDCDFGVLRGEKAGTTVANSDTAFIFRNKIINQDVTCTNGYVHQVGDVIVPPGNLAQVLATEDNTKLISRMLNYHCAPYYDGNTTDSYNSWARQNGYSTIDSIFQVRYFSAGRSQGGTPNTLDPSGASIPVSQRLNWDPGWNQYYPSSSASLALADMGAILAPTDEAVKEYFLPGGGGAYFIDLYGAEGLPNDEAHLPQNLDALFVKGNGIITTFLNNMLQNSFIASVPSKFGTITNSGSGDFMGLTLDDIAKTADQRYDIAIASNGVVYKMNSMLAPDEYQSVIGPALIYPDMSVMNHFASDKTTGANNSVYGADLYYYLMAMKANYAFFIPTDGALSGCYIDPISLKSAKPRALEFYSHVETMPGTERQVTYYGVKVHDYDVESGKISESIRETIANIESSNPSPFKSQVADMLSYSTVVLESGETIGKNHYYLTKHGGAVRITDIKKVGDEFVAGTVCGGAQIDNGAAPAHIVKSWNEKNGVAFRLDNVIQPSLTSVSNLLTCDANKDKFSEFMDMITIFENSELLDWAGISAAPIMPGSSTTQQTKYIVFSDKAQCALDQNINFFNGYNYTFYAPNNQAIAKARALGLPTVEDIEKIYDQYNGAEEEYPAEKIAEAKAEVLNKLNALRAFVRYHFQNNSVFADNDVAETTYQSMYSSELGIPVNITIKSVNGKLTVKDQNKTITIDANSTDKLVNKMTRDYEFNTTAANATSIAVSSFAAVHEVSEPLSYTADGRYDANWRTASARKQWGKDYQKLLQMIKNFKD